MNQIKIFRKIKNSESQFKATEYASTDSYANIIKAEKEQGYRQIIINSDLMLDTISKLGSKENFVLLEIEFNSSVDEEYTLEVNKHITDLRQNKLLLNELILNLAWSSEKESIDIEKLHFGYKEIDNKFCSITIISNGILSGTNPSSFFENYFLKIIQGYF